MRHALPTLTIAMSLVLYGVAVSAQEKSVKPGINDSFRDPDVGGFISKFETESREVFANRRKIVAALAIKPGQTIADIGAGTGAFTSLFSDAVGAEGHVVAVDISQKFLDHIAKTSRESGRANVQTTLCGPETVNLNPASVDLAFICDVYHHFEFPLKSMASLYRSMKPGGKVALIDFRREQGISSEWTMNHVRAGREVFEAEITRSGFRKVKDIEGILKENYFVIFEKPVLESPIIPGYGGVLPRPQAAEQPRAGAKVLFDITAESKPEDVHKGVERAARLLNLYGVSGLKATDVKIAIVLHGEATKTALSDTACKTHFGVDHNPNLPLIHGLKEAGVDVYVCGQALNYKGFVESEVAEDVSIAASAMTVSINRQADGFSVLVIP